MKNILFGITNLDMGGAERVLVDLVNELASFYNIHVLTIYAGGILEKNVDKRVKITSLVDSSYNKTSIIKRKIISLKLKLGMFNKKVKSICASKDTVVSFLEGPVTRLLSKAPNYKIAWVHTDLEKHYSKSKLDSIKDDYALYNKIIFVSNSSKESFDKVYNSEFVSKELVINNYIDKNRVINNKDEFDFKFNSPNFLVVARLVHPKGLERLISVHKTILNIGLNHYIYVIGDGPLKGKLEELIKENNVSETFLLLGLKENIYPYMKLCDKFLIPSLYEGYPMTVLEAKILNKRVLSTKTGVVDALADYENKVICENNEIELFNMLKTELENRFEEKKYKPYEFNNDIIHQIKEVL